ncbi:MAG TPA: ABC transporter permease [Oligoflexales bacterium]|nr:ABC transporter permease [Oligoflexales bacterium]
MEAIWALLLPIVQLMAVIAIAIALVSMLVGLLVALLKRYSSRHILANYSLMVALRILLGFTSEKPTLRERLIPVSAQNFIAMVGTAIGVWALIVVLSVMAGFEADLKGKIVRHSPHITVIPTLDMASASGDEQMLSGLVTELSKIPNVTAVEAFIEGDAMVTSFLSMSPGMTIRGLKPQDSLENSWLGDSTTPASLKALANPVYAMSDRELGFKGLERADSILRRPAVDGNQEAVKDDETQDDDTEDVDDEDTMPEITAKEAPGRVLPGILLGAELANSLGTAVGDEVTVIVPDGDVGPTGVRPRTRTYRISGTFVSGMYEHDLKTAYINYEEAKNLFLLGSANRVALMLKDIDHLDKVAPVAKTTVKQTTGGEIRTVAQVNKSLFSALMIEKIAMFLVLGLVILVAALNIFASLILITMEKTRDIAVLRSIGATSKGVKRIFLALGSVIGVVGIISGLILGLGTCAYIYWVGISLPSAYYLRELPVAVQPLDVVLVVVAAMLAGLLATLYPASSATSKAPSEGLRND